LVEEVMVEKDLDHLMELEKWEEQTPVVAEVEVEVFLDKGIQELLVDPE
jgi:hypothetical protein